MKADVRALIAKGRRSLKAAQRLFQETDYDFSASRAYYAMFYLAEALLLQRGLSFSKHAGVLAALYEQYVKPGRLPQTLHRALHRAFEARQQGDYGFEEPFPRNEAKELLAGAEDFLKAATALLKK